MTVLFLATAASRSTLSEKATSMMRSTPSGACARMAPAGSGWSSATACATAGVIDRSRSSRSSHRPDHGRTAPVRELRRQCSDTAEHAVHQDGRAGDRAVGEHCAVSGDPGDAQAGADLVRDARREGRWPARAGRQSVARRCRTAGRTGRRTPTRAGRSCAGSTPSPTDSIDPGAVAVRDDPRVRHRGAQPAAALLRVTGVHAREPSSARGPRPDPAQGPVSRRPAAPRRQDPAARTRLRARMAPLRQPSVLPPAVPP